jgi:SAM-dependent methyltransferase
MGRSGRDRRGDRGKQGKHGKRGKDRKARKQTSAQKADVYDLYEEAVQDPDGDAALIRRIFKTTYDRDPELLREDFCGTAALCCAWVKTGDAKRAFGIDLDPEPLASARSRNVAKLEPEQAGRVELLRGDVREVKHEAVDVTVGFNFSYFVFQERADLLAYFRRAKESLRPEGLFLIDLYGGAESQRTLTETREHDDFDYVWDQDVFDPINNRALNHIHFEFADGSRIDRAFTYDWRLWSIPELRDALHEAGFSRTDAYWERTDRKTNEGTGVYYRAQRAPDDPAWVAYIAALP